MFDRFFSAAIVALVACRGALTPPTVSTALASEAMPVPVYEERLHHLVFQNKYTRVLDVVIPAGEGTRFHTHETRNAGVVIQDGRHWSQRLGEPRTAVESGANVGEVLQNWSATLPYTHRVVNADTTAIHYVIAEWLASPHVNAAPLLETSSLKLVKEGAIARFYEVTLEPGASTNMHTHAEPGLTVQVTAGTPVDEGDAPAATGGSGAGAWRWRNRDHRHVLRNGGTTRVKVMEIDWR